MTQILLKKARISDSYRIYVCRSSRSLWKGSNTRGALSVWEFVQVEVSALIRLDQSQRLGRGGISALDHPNAVGTQVPAKPSLRMRAELDPPPVGGRRGPDTTHGCAWRATLSVSRTLTKEIGAFSWYVLAACMHLFKWQIHEGDAAANVWQSRIDLLDNSITSHSCSDVKAPLCSKSLDCSKKSERMSTRVNEPALCFHTHQGHTASNCHRLPLFYGLDWNRLFVEL